MIDKLLSGWIVFLSILCMASLTFGKNILKKNQQLEKVIKIEKRVKFVDYFPLEGERYSLIFRDLDTDEEFYVNFTSECNFKDKLMNEFFITQECNYHGDTLIKCEYYNLPIKICY